MPKLTPLSWKDFVRKLRRLGFSGPYSGGKHPFMVKADITLTIPNPHSKDVGVELQKRICKQAKISRKDWLAA
jgi:predicted RNA binding protein YcfA (HicA-like mRNA interferase family)